MAYDSARGKMVLFSGNAGAGTPTAGTWSPETWEWDGTAGTWTLITAPVVTSTQYGSGYTNMVYDPVINKIVLYYYWNYVWTYTAGATAGTGTWADAAPVPTKVDTAVSGYYNPGMVYDAGRQKVVVFGGQSSGRSLWELNSMDFTWLNRSAPANGPIQRQYPSLAFDSKAGKLMVFGGRSSVDNLYKQDIWEWAGTDQVLNPRTTGGLKPDARYQSAMVYDSKRDRLLLFGGYGTTSYDDLWSWSSETSEWTLISVPGARPSARYGHWMFYDAVRDKVYVFGQNGSGYQNWEFDPALNAWRDRTVTSPPAGVSRSYFDVTFDSNRGKIVMLGGYYASVVFVSRDDYDGPILVRTLPDSSPVSYSMYSTDAPPSGDLRLSGQGATSATPGWRHWLVYLRLTGPGCYALHVDGLDFSSLLVFEAVDDPPPATAKPVP
jgi:hypothetical protein